jgi:DNA-binding transcriptional LysR family regulator
VSKAIADMEHAVGLRLLDRTRQGTVVTSYGRALINHGTVIFDELKQAAQELEFLADPTLGELRIGSSESMAAGLLPAVIDRFSRQYPKVTLTVAQAVVATTHYRELRERSIDLLLGGSPSIVARKICNPRSRTRWTQLRRLTLADLGGEQWILPPADSLPRAAVAEVFRECRLEMPRAPLTTLSIHLFLELVATGRFVAMLPRSIFQFGGRNRPLKILPIKIPTGPRPVAIMRLKNRTLSPVAKVFIDCTRAVARAMPAA